MIVTAALNPAADLTYRLPAVRWSETNRVAEVRSRAGGKAINVARVLSALGQPVTVTGFAGGRIGDDIRAVLDAAGINHAFVPVSGETRRTVTILEADAATVFTEPGPVLSDQDWQRLLARITDLLPGADALVLSGSLPPGIPDDAYAVLVRLAAGAGVPAVLDADGAALLHGVAAHPAIVKPNAEELIRATGATEPLTGVAALRRAGAEAVVVSLGPLGMLASTATGWWRSRPPQTLLGNPTGAGDAAVAALAAGLVTGQNWHDRLLHATAASGAAVLAPVAGDLDHDQYRALLGQIAVSQLEGTPCLS
jgi:tagatose 6-phosphate kinase